MKCPSCGVGKLVRDTRDIQYVYKGETTTIPAVRGEFCPACGESVLAAAESKRVSAAMLEFNKQVNASIVDPGFIARVRRTCARPAAGRRDLRRRRNCVFALRERQDQAAARAGGAPHAARPAPKPAERGPGRAIEHHPRFLYSSHFWGGVL